jgi:hypothetical protein
LGTAAHPDENTFPPNKGDFGTRLNFAYSPLANNKMVFRGGIDLIYTNGISQLEGMGFGASQNPGIYTNVSWTTDATGQNLVGPVPAFILSQGAPSLPPFADARA